MDRVEGALYKGILKKKKVYLKRARSIMQEISKICNKYYAQRDQAVDGVEGALCRQNDGVGSARLRLTVHTANTDTQNTKYLQQKTQIHWQIQIRNTQTLNYILNSKAIVHDGIVSACL